MASYNAVSDEIACSWVVAESASLLLAYDTSPQSHRVQEMCLGVSHSGLVAETLRELPVA